MKAGDYVRTEYGIAKITKKLSDKEYALDSYIMECYIEGFDNHLFKEDIIKSSPNIIDLIEVGDYVNGHKVIYTAGEKHKLVYVEYVNMDKLLEVKSYQIKSIVTKEQFGSMEYKI